MKKTKRKSYYYNIKCEYTGGRCWFDGSCLASTEVFKKFVTEGEEALWKELEKYYMSWIEKED